MSLASTLAQVQGAESVTVAASVGNVPAAARYGNWGGLKMFHVKGDKGPSGRKSSHASINGKKKGDGRRRRHKGAKATDGFGGGRRKRRGGGRRRRGKKSGRRGRGRGQKRISNTFSGTKSPGWGVAKA